MQQLPRFAMGKVTIVMLGETINVAIVNVLILRVATTVLPCFAGRIGGHTLSTAVQSMDNQHVAIDKYVTLLFTMMTIYQLSIPLLSK